MIIAIYSNFTICNDFSQVSQDQDDQLLYAPVKFTDSGLKSFFKDKYNNPKYAQDLLPHNLSDLIQFFEFSKVNQNKNFIKSTVRIFHQKFKYVEYLNAPEFNRFVNKTADLLDYYQTSSNQLIKNMIYTQFNTNYDFFKENPKKFISDLAEDIYFVIQLKLDIFRLIESATGKLVWFVEDEPDIWTQFKQTADCIYNLYQKNIISDEIGNINDVLHSAIARFILILEVRGSSLDPQFYQKTIDEINNNNSLKWLYIEEQDEYMDSKKNILLMSLKNSQIKAVARGQYGIIT
jgi:hypothetical protein